MVHVITSANRDLYGEALEAMFVMRFHVAVNELGWTIPNMASGRDKDAYDREDTVYFIEYDDDGEVIATARLNPTTKPHLMTDVFSTLCEFDGVPQSDDVFEYSRFLVRKQGVSRRRNLEAQAHISLAIVEYCLAAGISHVSWVSYKKSYPLALRMWKTRPLGLPQYFKDDDAHYIAAISEMSPESLQRTRDLSRIQKPVCQITLPLQRAPHLTRLPVSSLTLFG
ncbi:MAG: acyl-homoserine-lactone synthase [Alphaproteobacteria bacterium]